MPILVFPDINIDGCHVDRYYQWSGSIHFEAYGNVFVVTSPTESADIYVKLRNSSEYASWTIYKTTKEPKRCGEWRFVTDPSKAKFTIKFVDDNEDITIRFTTDPNNIGFNVQP
jgi:hypothetical protein